MIIFFQSGRLGNQLFQYSAMRMFAPDASILAVGMDDLRQGFAGVSLSRLSIPMQGGQVSPGRHIKSRWLCRLVHALARLRLVTVVDEAQTADGPRHAVTRGLLRRIVYFRRGWYQAESIANSPHGLGLRIKPELRAIAAATLAALPGRPHDRYFVHVRRGDYTGFPTAEHPAVLPLAWYREQMSRVRERNPDAVFVVTSDDKPYVDEFLAGLPGVCIVHRDVLEDFAVMAGCLGGGVLSASSFSWWAAWFVRRESHDALFIAPRYWAGHGVQTWMPAGIETSWIEYADVDRR